jgi:hypothetical protein
MTELEIPPEIEIEEEVVEEEAENVTEINVPVIHHHKEYTKKEKEQIKKDLLEGKQHEVYE